MSIYEILNEASNILYTAQRHERELEQAGLNSDELFYFRSLIAQIALEQFANRKATQPIETMLQYFKKMDTTIVHRVQESFGVDSPISKEFESVS
jgi:hypothetical protein